MEDTPVMPACEEAPTQEEAPMHWSLSSVNQGMLGVEIPYKDPSSFFVPKSPRQFSHFTGVPSSGLPNPLFGMATSGSYVGGDSISQAKKSAPAWECQSQVYLESKKWMRIPSIRDSRAGTHLRIWTGIPIQRPALALHGLEIDKHRLNLLGKTCVGQVEAKVFAVLMKENIRLQEVQEMQAVTPQVAMMGMVRMMNTEEKIEDHILRGDIPAERTRRHQAIETLYPLLLQEPPYRQGGNGGSSGGDGGGSGGGDGNGGGRNGIDQHFLYIAPGAPYGTMVPTIELKLKVETLPEWDGDHNTAIDYFWEVGE
ncbi:hypothetical protein B0H13DRAFT_2369157 [Mycena leptocephala]|nr:hypothetical protein B0H13DRAFT_2369157 [Mycena leptocephala]